VRSTIAAVMVLAAAPAYAGPDDLVARPLVLPAGAVEVRLTAEIAVRYHRGARLVSLAPDAWWGVSRRWTLGVIHSNPSVDRIDAGASVCVADNDATLCDQAYRGGGVDVRFSALDGALAVAPRARALIRDLDPFKPAITVGAQARWTRGRFAIVSDPYLRLPLANHDLGNRAALVVPIWLAVQPASGWQIDLHTGYDADLVVFRDGGHGPFSLGVTARLPRGIELRVEAGWAQLLGPQFDAKNGALLITTGWRG
jgi:hypothetical protein